MISRLTDYLPLWLRPDHPVLRYYVSGNAAHRRRQRWLRLTGLALFVGSGTLIASDMLQTNPFEQPFSRVLHGIFYWPAFAVQLLLQLMVLTVTLYTLSGEKRRHTWDHLRTTASGTALIVRAQWGAIVLYRARYVMGLLTGVRLLLVVGLLYDLTAFGGEYLFYLSVSAQPAVPLSMGVVLLALMVVAALLLPFTAAGFDAACGIVIAAAIRQRTFVALIHIVLVIGRVLLIGYFLFTFERYRLGMLAFDPGLLWLVLLAFGVLADWGLAYLYLGFFGGQIWTEVPYGVFMGATLLVFVLAQAVATDLLLGLAGRLAQRSE